MRSLAGVVTLLVGIGVAACGGTKAPPGATGAPLKSGGTLTILSYDDVDSLDPGAAVSVLSGSVLSLVHRTLYAYFPGDTRPDPDLAAGPPVVSEDGRTVTVRLRRGIHFSGPVSREVRSADIKYAFERAFSRSVANPLAGVLYGELDGLDAYRAGDAPGIAGIATPDTHTVAFHLRHGTGTAFAAALATLVTAPVPPEYARSRDRRFPSTYADAPAVTGPYRIASVDRGKRIVLERNPDWVASTDRRPAYADRIEVRVGGSPDVLSREIASGDGRISGSFTVARSVVRRLARENPAQITQVPGAIMLLTINTSRPPLDRLDVRKAIAFAIDRTGLIVPLGGGSTVATHFLPPGMPGFEEAGGEVGTEAHAVATDGDVEQAKALIESAGAPGCKLSLFASTNPEETNTAVAIAADLRRVGIETELRTFRDEALYTNQCGVPAEEIDLCLIGILPFPNQPNIILDALFNGDRITPSGNTNMSQLDDPDINEAIDAAALANPAERGAVYGALDRRITATAAAVPIGWLTLPQIRSADVRGEAGPDGWNPAFLAVR